MRKAVSSMVTVVAALGAVVVLQAHWSGVASTGTIDEGDISKIVLNNDGSATIRTTISSTSAKIRFNVGPSELLLTQPPTSDGGAVEFAMRFRDNGPDARVIATLKQVGLWGFHGSATQTTEVLATIDSDEHFASDQWQSSNPPTWRRIVNGLDFVRYGYVVEVQIIKDNAAGNPGLMGVQLYRDDG